MIIGPITNPKEYINLSKAEIHIINESPFIKPIIYQVINEIKVDLETISNSLELKQYMDEKKQTTGSKLYLKGEIRLYNHLYEDSYKYMKDALKLAKLNNEYYIVLLSTIGIVCCLINQKKPFESTINDSVEYLYRNGEKQYAK